MTAEQPKPKELHNPEDQLRDIIVSLNITTKEAYSRRLRGWKFAYSESNSLFAALSGLHQRLKPTTVFHRRFKEIYGGGPSSDYIVQLIDPERTLTNEAREKVKKIWRS